MRSLLVLSLLGCRAAAEPPPPEPAVPSGFWEHWGDGRAELDGYRIVQPRYGELRDGEAVWIFVTEDFTRAQRVKSDGGHADAYPVLKWNEARDFSTGIYDYNGMTSGFAALDGSLPRGIPTKVSFSMQEWCGQTWGQLAAEPEGLAHHWHSYFDGEADGAETLGRPAGGVSEDLAPILVRGLLGEWVAPGATVEVPWLPRLMAARLDHEPLAWTTATVTRSLPVDGEERWTITTPERTLAYRVESAAPHKILGWEASDGERGELTGSVRLPYWQRNREGDEALRAQLGLAP